MNAYCADFADGWRSLVEDLRGKRVAVVGHQRPDGDCIGSQVALCRCLNALEIESVAVNSDPVPRLLRAFVGDTPFLRADKFGGGEWTAVNVDCADPVRVGRDLHRRFPRPLANIDHHISNLCYAEYNFVDPEASASAEILAGFFFDCDLPVDEVSAQALYVGIATDTGQFRFSSMKRRVFDICGELVSKGARPGQAAVRLYEQESIGKVKLLARFLSSLRFEFERKVCIGLLRDGVYEETGASKEDSEGLVDYARSIQGVQIGVLIEEQNGAIKGSFRSRDPEHRVDRLARRFGGGGHACAAGFNFKASLDDFHMRLMKALRDHFEGRSRVLEELRRNEA